VTDKTSSFRQLFDEVAHVTDEDRVMGEVEQAGLLGSLDHLLLVRLERTTARIPGPTPAYQTDIAMANIS